MADASTIRSLSEASSAELIGGWVNAIDIRGNAQATVRPGGYINIYLYAYGNSVVDIYGGRMPDRYLEAGETSLVNLYVQIYQFLPGNGVDNDGLITGKWADGNEFSLALRLPQTFSHVQVHLVPEPSAVILVLGTFACLVVLAARHRGQRSCSNCPQ